MFRETKTFRATLEKKTKISLWIYYQHMTKKIKGISSITGLYEIRNPIEIAIGPIVVFILLSL